MLGSAEFHSHSELHGLPPQKSLPDLCRLSRTGAVSKVLFQPVHPFYICDLLVRRNPLSSRAFTASYSLLPGKLMRFSSSDRVPAGWYSRR